MSKIISQQEYFADVETLHRSVFKKLTSISCIVALKRSGLMMGAFMSNRARKPLFFPSEIHAIPEHFTEILLVDDKICTGKSIAKVRNRLESRGKTVHTACMYVERDIRPDFHIRSTDNSIVKMWYEV